MASTLNHTDRERALQIVEAGLLAGDPDHAILTALEAAGLAISRRTLNGYKTTARQRLAEGGEVDLAVESKAQIAALKQAQQIALTKGDPSGVAVTNKRICSMLGLDAPAKSEVTQTHQINIKMVVHRVLTDYCERRMAALPEPERLVAERTVEEIFAMVETELER